MLHVCMWKEWGGAINRTDVDFLSQIHVSLNNLLIKYPPLAPPKTNHRHTQKGAPRSVWVSVCGLTLHTPATRHSPFSCNPQRP